MEMWPEGTKAKTGGQAVKECLPGNGKLPGWTQAWGHVGQGGGKAREAGWILASQDLKCQAEQPDFV